MADNNQSTDQFKYCMSSVASWVTNTTSQQTFQPVKLDPHGITEPYVNLNHYHYNINPLSLGQESHAGSMNKIIIEGMPPGRPKQEKPKFTRAPITYGEYKRMRDAFVEGSATWYSSSAPYATDSVPKGNFNNAIEDSWDDDPTDGMGGIQNPPATMIEYQTSHNNLESRTFSHDGFSSANRQNDGNNSDRSPREPQSGDWDYSKCNVNSVYHHDPKGDDVQSYQSDGYNDRNANNRPPREPRPGDWDCTKCNASNFSHRSECFRCHELKGDAVQSYQSDGYNDRKTNSRPPREPRPGDWDCTKCNANNFSHRSECFRCHEPKGDDVQSYQSDGYNDRNTNNRPPREPRPGDWDCTKCNANNFSHRSECFRCHEPKGDDVQSYQSDGHNDRNTNNRPPREPRPGDWDCAKCKSNNFSHRNECFRCHEPKGDDVQSYQSDGHNDRNTSSRPPREPRPGDWNCIKCKANNFSHRMECFRCHEPKGDDVQSYQSDGHNDRNTNNRPPREPRPGDWDCAKCKANNFSHRMECFRCHEPKGDDVQSYQSDGHNDRNTNSRPPREPRPGDWDCAKCKANNFSHRMECFRCHESKGDDVQSRESHTGSPSRNNGFGSNSWGGGDYGVIVSTTAQDEDDWDDDEPKVVSNQQIEKRKLSSDFYGDDKFNDSPGPHLKKRKLSDDWDDDNDDQDETIKLSEVVFNTDDKYSDEMGVVEDYENNFEEKQERDVEHVDKKQENVEIE